MVNRDKPHRRYNPLIGEWVLVSPQRDLRPWLGKVESAMVGGLPAYDPNCYLCPGNLRAGGLRNPQYQGPYVFDNDFPALMMIDSQSDSSQSLESQIFRAEQVSGTCRVVCFSERHDLSIPQLSPQAAFAVVDCWADQTNEILGLPNIQYIQVFENKGELMGCSNPHPHSQIWATSYIPDIPAKEMACTSSYLADQNSCLLCDILVEEQRRGERIVCENDHFSTLVPFWAVWPFEILLICKAHLNSLRDLDASAKKGLADILQKITTRYDNLFEISFPYSFGFHQSAEDISPDHTLHLHAHFYPPLLRSADVRKFMVGFEMLAMPQRDITPEIAARSLREMPSIHYLSK